MVLRSARAWTPQRDREDHEAIGGGGDTYALAVEPGCLRPLHF